MALTVETGAGVVNADSYVTLAEVRAYATGRGYTVSAVDATLETLVRRATSYLEGLRQRYQGSKLRGSGYLQWPRSGVIVDGFNVETTEIPKELKDAQCQLVVELATVDPMPTQTGAAVKSETIDVISTVYAVADGGREPLPRMPKVDALLRPLFAGGQQVIR